MHYFSQFIREAGLYPLCLFKQKQKAINHEGTKGEEGKVKTFIGF